MLGTNLAVEENNTIIYKFFEKPMSANMVHHALLPWQKMPK